MSCPKRPPPVPPRQHNSQILSNSKEEPSRLFENIHNENKTIPRSQSEFVLSKIEDDEEIENQEEETGEDTKEENKEEIKENVEEDKAENVEVTKENEMEGESNGEEKKNENTQRFKVINEILETEKTYIESIEKLIQMFTPLFELKLDQSEFPVSEMHILHSNAGIILGYSKILEEMLTPSVLNFCENTCIGSIFLSLADYMRSIYFFYPPFF